MAKRLPPLNPLRAFEAAARHGSLTKAAGELHVTHGAVSHQIRALEASLSVKLFERTGQRLKLTAHGAELLPAVSSAFEEIAAATARMTRPTTAGALSVTCVPALLSLWLLPRIGGFLSRYPQIRLTLDASNDPGNVHSPDVDVAILYGDGSWTDLWVKLWTPLDLFPVVSPTLINNRPIRTIRDLGDHVMLHADDGREWHTWLAAADALDLKRGQQVHMSDARLAIEAAMHGVGVALGDTMTVASLLSRGQLVAPFNLAVPAVDAFYVACRKDLRAAPIVNVFIDWLFAALEEDNARAEPLAAARRALRRAAGKSPEPGRRPDAPPRPSLKHRSARR
ncbi:transcriptional regulator GcvA [Chelativorans intermedius]|uniref:Transcriptional regulator GcvA n=1 Tax=Chelativorans intermedius TaxID=515947 RepID=A0ABV6D5W7_9HYPH|nr:transcriptional regulator GcvA [Chelativorans intermedius]MCT8997502.1 transcriptional regulator GcvA [Chelativorans intermedius]